MEKRSKKPEKYQNKKSNDFVTLQNMAQQSKRERERRKKTRVQKTGDKTRCEHCGGPLKPRGAVGCVGHLRWKCRRCGRTVWTRPDYKIPVPICPIDRLG